MIMSHDTKRILSLDGGGSRGLFTIQVLKKIESYHGRTRGKEKFESRTLDLDQLLYGDLVMQMDGVNLPHTDILRYNFVLKPLTELAGDVEHPEEEKTINELWGEQEDNGELNIVEYDL